MTAQVQRDIVLDLARKAGYGSRWSNTQEFEDFLVDFFNSASNYEREKCAQICEDNFSSDGDWCSRKIRARSNLSKPVAQPATHFIIKKCSNPVLWYSKKINKVFPILWFDKDKAVWTREDDGVYNATNWVYLDDVELLVNPS